MKQRNNSLKETGKMSILFSLLLLFVFVLSAMFLVLIGSQVYDNIQQQNRSSFYSDTASNYIANKIRQFDSIDSIQIREENGQELLVLTSQHNNQTFETWIYVKNGFLMELYTPINSGLTLEDGLPLLPCHSLSFSLDTKTHLLTIQLQQQKHEPVYSLNLLLRSTH